MSGDSSSEFEDRIAIREVIENWAIWRDSGDFDSLATTFHVGGRMHATWFQGSAEEFCARGRESFARGNMSSHTLGGCSIRLSPARGVGGAATRKQEDARAVAQTRVTLWARDTFDGAAYDIVCVGRFYDLFERRDGRWAIAERYLTYEKDRADPVRADRTHEFDRTILDRYPVGYRHLAYAQVKRGLDVHPALPGLRGPEVEALYARGARWLERAG